MISFFNVNIIEVYFISFIKTINDNKNILILRNTIYYSLCKKNKNLKIFINNLTITKWFEILFLM